MTKHHLRLDIKGALMNWPMHMFKGLFRYDDGRQMIAVEAKAALLLELSKGHNYLPMGDCSGFDPIENGCPGHEQKEEVIP